MPSFILRNLDPDFWSQVQAKATREGVTVKALILRLLTQWLGAAVVASVTVACGGVHQTTFEPLYRSAQAVDASTTTGVTYAQFLPLVQAFNTEIAIARDRASNDAERILIDDYMKAAAMYQDSLTIWAGKIRRDGVIPSVATDYGYFPGGASYDERLHAIWNLAAVWTAAGHAVYTGKALGSS